MSPLDAINILESPEENWSGELVIEAWQTLISSGVIWQLQGGYQRMAVALVAEGVCHV